MGYQLKQPLLASMLADMLCLPWRGQNIWITQIRSFSAIGTGSLCYSKEEPSSDPNTACVVIAPPGSKVGIGAIIEALNPRLAFARALHAIESHVGFQEEMAEAIISADATISKTAVIGRGVRIGARTTVGHNVVIADGVTIGIDCCIKSNTVIGESGFGFERDEQGIPVRILHLGTVIIGDRVEIGSCNTVCRATLGATVIEDDVKTDDHVHIAHNCRIRRASLLTACVELSGGVDVGEYSWIGPNASVIQKIKLGNHAFVGIGSNVTKSVAEGCVVAGNPARVIRTENKS